MQSLMKNFRHVVILIGILLLILGAWYFLNNRQINEAPDRADLVFYGESTKHIEWCHG